MNLTKGQLVVLRAFKSFGPMDDVALTVYVHHIADSAMSSSGIRSRRAELARKGYIAITGTKRVKSGRRAAVHGITPFGKAAVRAARKRVAV